MTQFKFLVLIATLFMATAMTGCFGSSVDDENGGDADSDGDTDTDTDADTDADTDSDTDSDADGDYWETGNCPEGDGQLESLVSDNCNGVTDIGCCDAAGNIIYCGAAGLYCAPCGSIAAQPVCTWYTADDSGLGDYYWCSATDNGADPSGTNPISCGDDPVGGDATGKFCNLLESGGEDVILELVISNGSETVTLSANTGTCSSSACTTIPTGTGVTFDMQDTSGGLIGSYVQDIAAGEEFIYWSTMDDTVDPAEPTLMLVPTGEFTCAEVTAEVLAALK